MTAPPVTAPRAERPLGPRLVAVLLFLSGANALVQVPQGMPAFGNDPLVLSLEQLASGTAGVAAAVATWRARAWAWKLILLWGALAGTLIMTLGPVLDLEASARDGLVFGGVAVLLCAALMAWYVRRQRAPAGAVAGLAALLGLAAPEATAQTALLDSIRPQVERAIVRAEWGALDAVAARLRRAVSGPAARDPWTHYDLGYVLHRRASALLVAKRVDEAKPLLEEAERALARAETLGAGAQALGLRGAVTGQLAGTGGMMAGMRNGPRAFRQLDDALAAAPRDPRVALMNGMTRLNAPRAFGGGPAKGEPELRRAVALFAADRAASPEPTWGRVDAHIWLAIALEQLDRRDEARAELERALALAPGHAWITRELLPALDRPKPR